jgi:hypothetical protein
MRPRASAKRTGKLKAQFNDPPWSDSRRLEAAGTSTNGAGEGLKPASNPGSRLSRGTRHRRVTPDAGSSRVPDAGWRLGEAAEGTRTLDLLHGKQTL